MFNPITNSDQIEQSDEPQYTSDKPQHTSDEPQYTLDELLNRGYKIISLTKDKHKLEKNVSDGKLKLERPLVERKDRKTYVSNFGVLAKSINRLPFDLLKYFEEEIKIDMSLKPDNTLKIDKPVTNITVENVYKSYITNHIMCGSCHSLHTRIEREGRLSFMICDICLCKRSVN